ncbi:MAG: PmoA family protein [Phycisphaerae bacterium]|nr:PmoA family protein [Phycisphaerae bacterium]
MKYVSIVAAIALTVAAVPARPPADKTVAIPKIEFRNDTKTATQTVTIDGKEAFVYLHGEDLETTCFYPVRSPSGKLMTLKIADDKKKQSYPHHRSFWFTDKIQLDGQRDVNFYASYYTGIDKKDPKSKKPFRDRIKHVKFLRAEVLKDKPVAHTSMKLVWEADRKTPYLDETRDVRIVALGGGQYFLDITFTVTAAYGNVRFTSDSVHYAWPYVRMHPQFSVDKGGTITNSEGGVNQKGTHDKVAVWIDYSGVAGGVTEGLAIFSHPDNDHPHKWLTRNYGCFGPRRIDARSGNKKYVLKKGESLKRRVGILVHRGDVKAGQVARRYKMYVAGKL